MSTYTISKGYVSVATPRRSKYPFALIKEGEFITQPFPWSDLKKVGYSVAAWNRSRKACLRINKFPDGTPENPNPHFFVGWPEGIKPGEGRKGKK